MTPGYSPQVIGGIQDEMLYDTAQYSASGVAGDIVVVGTTASSRYEFYQGPIIIDKIYYPGTNAWIAAVAMDTMARKWTFTFGGDSNDIANSVDTDNSGYAYACGTFYSSQFNMTAYNGSRILYNVGGSDGWLVSLNSSGGIVWAQQIGDAFDDTCDVVKRNPSATAIWVGGSFASEQMDLGNGVILTNSNPGTLNMYLIKYDSSGNAQAAYQYGGIGADTLNDFAFSPDGNYIYIAGRFISPTLNFGNGVVLLRNNTKSGYEGFLVKVSATTGAAQWAYSYSTNATDSADVVAVDTLGNVAVAGQYGGGFNLSIGNVVSVSSCLWQARSNLNKKLTISPRALQNQTRHSQAAETLTSSLQTTSRRASSDTRTASEAWLASSRPPSSPPETAS